MPGLEDLLRQMTLQEKVALLAGTNMWYTVPVERLGIPPLNMTRNTSRRCSPLALASPTRPLAIARSH